ncbi:MAG: extracellular solute-binding protein [Betaproteobacteria bacterium]|nr:extracellular solute-binding protein [Betaproteobacteria bacterium]
MRIARSLVFTLAAAMVPSTALAQGKLAVSIWGGSWRDFVAENVGKRFTAETGAQVEFITGGTIDRLNKAKLSKANPETDVIFTTSHVGWLYASDDLYEKLDMSKLPNSKSLFPEAIISPFHVGAWSYVYTIAYRPDLVPADIKFTSWADLWNPKLKGMIGLPDFDPSHIIYASALLSGAKGAKDWTMGQKKLLELKPNIKAFYSSDATSQEKIGTGETPVQVLLSGNAYHMMTQGVKINLVVPKEGAIIGIDTVGINKGSKNAELAYKFMNILLDPATQTLIGNRVKMSPMSTQAKLEPDVVKLPGMFSSAAQWKTQAIVIDHKQRAELLGEWRKWFTENIIAR